MVDITTRFNFLIDKLGISVLKLSSKIGVSQQVLYNYTKGRTPSLEVIEKILNVFPDIDANWLLTGKGEMIKIGSYAESNFAIRCPFVSKYEIDNYLENSNSAEYIMNLPKISIIPTTREFGHTAFEIVDDSMKDSSAGCLNPGDLVICSAFEKETIFNLTSEITCLFFHKDLGYSIRKVKNLNKESKSFLAVPLNPLYKNTDVSLEDIIKIFFVHQAITIYQ